MPRYRSPKKEKLPWDKVGCSWSPKDRCVKNHYSSELDKRCVRPSSPKGKGSRCSHSPEVSKRNRSTAARYRRNMKQGQKDGSIMEGPWAAWTRNGGRLSPFSYSPRYGGSSPYRRFY